MQCGEEDAKSKEGGRRFQGHEGGEEGKLGEVV